jgi:hypothetical protein
MSPAVTKFARAVLSTAVRAALAGYRVAIGYARVRPRLRENVHERSTRSIVFPIVFPQ